MGRADPSATETLPSPCWELEPPVHTDLSAVPLQGLFTLSSCRVSVGTTSLHLVSGQEAGAEAGLGISTLRGEMCTPPNTFPLEVGGRIG